MRDTRKVTLAAVLLLSLLGLAYMVRARRTPRYVEPTPDVKYHVREVLHGDEPRSQVASIAALAGSGDDSARSALEQVAARPDAPVPVVAAAIRALGVKKDPRSVPVIARRLTRSTEETTLVRFAAVRALRDIGDPHAFAALKTQVTRRNPVAIDAVWAMGWLRDPETGLIPPAVEGQLIAYLGHPVPRIRLGAVYGLGAGGTRRGLAALETLTKDPLGGIGAEFLEEPVAELAKGEKARRELVAAPCTRAIDAIRARLAGRSN